VSVNRIPFFVSNIAECVDGFTDHVQYAPQRSFTYRHRNRTTGIDGLHPSHHAVSWQHGNGANAPFTEMLLYFSDDFDGRRHVKTVRNNSKRLIDGWQILSFEFDVDHRTDDLDDFTDVLCIQVSIRRRHTVVELLFEPIKATNWQVLKAG
jgi:hypothetical protein